MKNLVKISLLLLLFFSASSSVAHNKIPFKIDNREVILDDFRGKYVILQFWATWCPYCKIQMPVLSLFKKRYHNNRNVAILPVSIDKGGYEEVSDYYKSSGIENLDVVTDKKKNLFKSLGLRGVPTVVLISKDGEIIERFNSVSQINTALFDKMLK